jgi:hypothetical protein
VTWVERILATPCPLPSCGAKAGEACDVERGMRSVRSVAPLYFHASRIAAAEGAGLVVPAAPKRTCNRHDDCDAANGQAMAVANRRAYHCHNDCCEDCFGS